MGSSPQKAGTTTEISCEASRLLRTHVFDNSSRELGQWTGDKDTLHQKDLKVKLPESWDVKLILRLPRRVYPSPMAWDNELQIQEATYWFILLKGNIRKPHVVYLYCFTC